MSFILKTTIFAAMMVFATQSFALSYPGDCTNAKLERAAKKNGCSLSAGGNHWKVMKGGNMITTIPYSVKANGTCRSIITILNNQC